MAKDVGRFGTAGLGFAIGISAILFATSLPAEEATKHIAAGTTELDRAEQIQTEYAAANGKLCDAGNLVSCEAADDARDGLNLLKATKESCKNGDAAACARMDQIAPLVIQSADFSCETIALSSCPRGEVLSGSENAAPTTNTFEEMSNPAATDTRGVVIVNGSAVSPTGGAPALPPH